MKPGLAPILAAGLLLAPLASPAPESAPQAPPGIRSVRLVTDASAVVPGRPLTVGLLLDPEPGHHTYWRGPGIVGVATRLEWNLPPGFAAGPIRWPPPETVLMAGIVAHGFKKEVLLLTEISIPEELADEEVALSARASWMACAVSCNPGVADLSLVLPVARARESPARDETLAARFEAARRALPGPAPEDWRAAPRLAAPNRIELDLAIPGLAEAATAGIRFFCDDMQVDSDRPQRLEWIDSASGKIRLHLARPDFAPDSPERLSGLLHCPAGWPGTAAQFVELSVPWPATASPNAP